MDMIAGVSHAVCKQLVMSLLLVAGKKTAPYSGEVFCNGKPRDEFFKRMIAYVPQEDRMPQHWTVSI